MGYPLWSALLLAPSLPKVRISFMDASQVETSLENEEDRQIELATADDLGSENRKYLIEMAN